MRRGKNWQSQSPFLVRLWSLDELSCSGGWISKMMSVHPCGAHWQCPWFFHIFPFWESQFKPYMIQKVVIAKLYLPVKYLHMMFWSSTGHERHDREDGPKRMCRHCLFHRKFKPNSDFVCWQPQIIHPCNAEGDGRWTLAALGDLGEIGKKWIDMVRMVKTCAENLRPTGERQVHELISLRHTLSSSTRHWWCLCQVWLVT